jgi:hypothetical protein
MVHEVISVPLLSAAGKLQFMCNGGMQERLLDTGINRTMKFLFANSHPRKQDDFKGDLKEQLNFANCKLPPCS